MSSGAMESGQRVEVRFERHGPIAVLTIDQPEARVNILDERLWNELEAAIDWALAENRRSGSRYFGRIDPNQIAISGFSCSIFAQTVA